MAKYIWVQDLNFLTEGGGAQLTDRAHFLEGIRRGCNIKVWTPNVTEIPYASDNVIIASNPVFLPPSAFYDMSKRGVLYVWFLHDYAPVCKYRLFFPMQEKCGRCYLKERWMPILLKSKLIIWLSPLHRESWLKLCPELDKIPYHLSPSPVEVDLFHDMGLPRKGVVAVESLYPFKGREHVLRWTEQHPEVKVTFVGGNPQPRDGLPPNAVDLGPVPYEKMNEVYNHHEAFLHLPQSPSPFDRTVVEAYLAGCRIIGNENVGALSWPFFKGGRTAVGNSCRSSSRGFWEAVESAV